MDFEYKVEQIGPKIKVCSTDDHNFGTDAILLFDFAKIKKRDKICDFGTGCGIIGLLSVEKTNSRVFGVEIQPKAYNQAKKSAEMSGYSDRFVPILADLKELGNHFASGELTLVFCNPPYFKVGSGKTSDNEAKAIARQEIKCNIYDVAEAAGRYLADKGSLYVCHRPERLADIIDAFRKNRIEPKRIRFCKSDAEKSPWLFLMEGRKNASAGMIVMPDLVVKPGEEPTDTYMKYRKEKEE